MDRSRTPGIRLHIRALLVLCMLHGTGMLLCAQSESSDFARIGHAAFLSTTATDYQCVGVNPANLGFVPETEIFTLAEPLGSGVSRRRKDWAFTMLEGGASVHSNAISKDGLLDVILQQGGVKFTPEQKVAAADAFSGNGIRFNADIILIGLSVQTQWAGGIAFTVRERGSGNFVLNNEAASVIFEGRQAAYFDSLAVNWRGDTVGFAKRPKRYSELFNGTTLSMVWYREYAASYGVRLLNFRNVKLYAGVTAKALEAFAYLDARADGTNFAARSALSPYFGINYGNANTPSYIPGSALAPVGLGWGMDLGATLELGDLTLSASMIDLGKMTFDGNVFTAGDTVLNGLSSTGFNNYNIFNEAQLITGDGGFFKWGGLQTAATELPTRAKFGASYFVNYRTRIGVDVIASINRSAGSLEQPLVSAGIDYRPLTWIKLGGGVGWGGTMGVFVPVSVMFSFFGGTWELGVSSRDVVTYLAAKQPVMSLAIGVMRLRF